MQNSDFENIISLIEEARNRTFSKVNEELILLYYNVGKTVSLKVANGAWGDNTVNELADFIASKQTNLKGFNRRGLYRMKQFYETYNENSDCFKLWIELKDENVFVSTLPTQLQITDNKIDIKVSALPTQIHDNENLIFSTFVSTLLTQLTWSNHLEILSKSKKAEESLYYLIMSVKENWSMREIRRQISSSSFERSLIVKKTNTTTLSQIQKSFFKDPYIFEFLDLPDTHNENDLEKALIKNLQKFIIELGKGFTFMGNQFRLQVGNKDFSTDLLFYHRDLQCLVLFELKTEEFQPEFIGKLNFYLEALDRDVKRPHENQSIGILLCKGKDNEVVEYSMARNYSPALIADYETKLIDKKILAQKLHELSEMLEITMRS